MILVTTRKPAWRVTPEFAREQSSKGRPLVMDLETPVQSVTVLPVPFHVSLRGQVAIFSTDLIRDAKSS
jgi:hypothetical protein